MPTTIHGLVHLARRALGVSSQGKFGSMMGASAKTGQRWETGLSRPSHATLCDMARRVYPVDPALAAQLAAAAGTNLVALGVVKPPVAPQPAPPAPPVAPPAPPVEDVVDSIVCAAADAMNALPRDVRPALIAAFARTRRLGLDLQTVEDALKSATARPPG
jgi:hypothetical protein